MNTKDKIWLLNYLEKRKWWLQEETKKVDKKILRLEKDFFFFSLYSHFSTPAFHKLIPAHLIPAELRRL
ncbi:unnamed protein product, partial [marine sediment metagenome]